MIKKILKWTVIVIVAIIVLNVIAIMFGDSDLRTLKNKRDEIVELYESDLPQSEKEIQAKEYLEETEKLRMETEKIDPAYFRAYLFLGQMCNNIMGEKTKLTFEQLLDDVDLRIEQLGDT